MKDQPQSLLDSNRFVQLELQGCLQRADTNMIQFSAQSKYLTTHLVHSLSTKCSLQRIYQLT
jgi:hypothetical protein